VVGILAFSSPSPRPSIQGHWSCVHTHLQMGDVGVNPGMHGSHEGSTPSSEASSVHASTTQPWFAAKTPAESGSRSCTPSISRNASCQSFKEMDPEEVEVKRIELLRSLKLIGSEVDEYIDAFAVIAKRTFGTPVALITLVSSRAHIMLFHLCMERPEKKQPDIVCAM
jgi:hypothetical protein